MPDEPSDWRKLLMRRGPRGRRSRRFSNWIRRLYHDQGLGTPFRIEDLILGCALNPSDKDDYAAAHRFLQKQFKTFYLAMQLFFATREFARYYDDGLSPEQLFEVLVKTATTWNNFPVWSDPDDERKYKLYSMPSFVRRFEKRGKAWVTEIQFKSEMLSFAFQKFPTLPPMYNRPQLRSNGVVIALPPGIECDICHQHFAGQAQLIGHYQRDHPDFFRNQVGGTRPPGPPTGLDALFGGM